jgi:Tfp pilus assembly protein PilN
MRRTDAFAQLVHRRTGGGAMKTARWTLGLSLLAALITAGFLYREVSARRATAEARGREAANRLAEQGDLRREIAAFQACKGELELKSALLDSLLRRSRLSSPGLLGALAHLPPGLQVESLELENRRLQLTGRARSAGDVDALGRSLRENELVESFEVRSFEAGAFALGASLPGAPRLADAGGPPGPASAPGEARP